jgi:hypothetical protein
VRSPCGPLCPPGPFCSRAGIGVAWPRTPHRFTTCDRLIRRSLTTGAAFLPGAHGLVRDCVGSAGPCEVQVKGRRRHDENDAVFSTSSAASARGQSHNHANASRSSTWHGLTNCGSPNRFAHSDAKSAPSAKKVFLRQGFTESGPEDTPRIQAVYDAVASLVDEFEAAGRGRTQLLWPAEAWHRDNFQDEFTRAFGVKFTARNFWEARRPMIEAADLVICVRTCLSESTALEIGYKVGFEHTRDPNVNESAIWNKIAIVIADGQPIKTTMLRNAQVLEPAGLRELFERLHA